MRKPERNKECVLVCLIALEGDLFLIDISSHFSNELQLETLKRGDSRSEQSANQVGGSEGEKKCVSSLMFTLSLLIPVSFLRLSSAPFHCIADMTYHWWPVFTGVALVVG